MKVGIAVKNVLVLNFIDLYIFTRAGPRQTECTTSQSGELAALRRNVEATFNELYGKLYGICNNIILM